MGRGSRWEEALDGRAIYCILSQYILYTTYRSEEEAPNERSGPRREETPDGERLRMGALYMLFIRVRVSIIRHE